MLLEVNILKKLNLAFFKNSNFYLRMPMKNTHGMNAQGIPMYTKNFRKQKEACFYFQ